VNLRDLTDCEHSVIGLKKVQDPRRFGVAEIRDNRISGFVEKPASKDVSPSNDAIVGIYYLKNSDKLFDSLDKLINKGIKTKGEFQLTDALTLLLESGEKFCPYYVDGWLDCGKVETILETNSYLLHKFNLRYKIPGALIKDPVFIGANTVLDNCIIGENVTVGNHCIIRNSIIKNSIIDDYATIENSILANTLVGEHSVVSGKMKELNIGDYSETID
jgi:glucose-1-phosphate thymidylyltransferase